MRRITFTDPYSNSVILGPPSGSKIKYVIESVSGFDAITSEQFTQKIPYNDGDYPIDMLLDERTIVIDGSIYEPNNLTTIMQRRAELENVLNPKNSKGTLLYEDSSGVSRYAYPTVSSVVFANKLATEPFQRFEITFIASDPWLYSAPITVGVRNITIVGDADTPPVVTISGPATNPILTNNGKAFKINKTLVSGETIIVVFDTYNISAVYTNVYGITANALSYVDLTSIFFYLTKGLNVLSLSSGTASITYSERYIGV